MDKLRVAVVYGGRSGEHEVSLRSAEAVIKHLDPARYEVVRYLISNEGKWDPRPLLPEPGANEVDVVFPVLHGTFGEDGTMQGLLELADLPYVGPGVLGSAVAMDKDASKRMLQGRGIPVVEWVTLRRGNLDGAEVLRRFQLPVFVKPANLGSSVGITKVKRIEDLQPALELAAQFDRTVIVERAITGRELECSVLGNDEPVASEPCEIIPSKEWYDYDDKYLLDKARTELPAQLDPATTEELRRIAVEAFRALGCEGMSRVDFLLETATNRLYVNEINTIPGFTSISMYPKMWEYSGVPFAQLIDRLIALALDRHRSKGELRYSR